MNLNALELGYTKLNQIVRDTDEDITINECYGERFIACGADNKTITINGTPGNALGAYLDGASVVVNGNVQDAVGDTMNEGEIVVNGSAGDALGYAMRGGKIFIKGNSGYRTGIHMKEYKEKKPTIVIGGNAGSFLGEYLAGGEIVVLGLGNDSLPVGNFTGTGMHGGKIWIRSNVEPSNLPVQVMYTKATDEELATILPLIDDYCKKFDVSKDEVMSVPFYKLIPNAKNPYKMLYTEN